jgi:hypothetical protein
MLKWLHRGEDEDDGDLWEYHADQFSVMLQVSRRHFIFGVELNEWTDGEAMILFWFGPLVLVLALRAKAS